MRINAHLYHKADDYRAEPCEIEKIIEVSQSEFALLYKNPLRKFDFIAENKEGLACDENGVNHCLLVLGEGSDDGILICSEGYDYARYSAHIPNARQVVFMEQRYNCLQDLESWLTKTADGVVSDALAYDGEGVFRVLMDDLIEEYNFDTQYANLLAEMLCEHSAVNNAEVIDDEIMISVNRQEKKQETQPEKLPFSHDRTAQLLDNALDWIGTQENGGELYNTLVERLHMSDEEIKAAGFDALSEYFYGPGEGEDIGITME